MSLIDDSKSWRPPLSGKDHQTDEALRIAYNHLFFLRDKLNSLESSSSESLTMDEIQNNLESGGSNVLNVTNLPGTLIEVQPSVLFGTYANRIKHSPKTNKYCLYVITDKGNPGGVIYYSNGSNWVYLIGTFSYGAKFQILFADKADFADSLTSHDIGLYVAITDRNNVTYYHNGTKLVYYSGSQPILLADIAALASILDLGNVSDDNLQISITDRDGVIYEWNTATARFEYLSGSYSIPFASLAGLAGTLGTKDTGFTAIINDRNNLVYIWSGTAFIFSSGGPYELTYANMVTLAATLGVNDTGLPVKITNWNNQIYTWDGTDFIWTFGEIVEFTWAQFAAITFSANDEGLRVYLSTYNHFLVYSVSGWEWNVYQDDLMAGAGPVLFEIDPGLGWELYDGSTVYYMKSDGTRGSVTLPDLTSTPSYLKGGAGSSGIDAASGTSGLESAHTHDVDPGATASGVPSATTDVQSGTGATVASSTHTHSTDIASTTSAAGSAHDHGPGTLELSRITRKAYFRQ